MSDDPDRSLACSTRGGNPTLESDEELQRPQRYLRYLRRAESAPTRFASRRTGVRRSRKGLHRPFRRPRHARRPATLAEIYSAIRSSHTSCLKSAPTSEWLALRQWRASWSPTGVRSFVPAPASPRRRNRRATGRRQDVVYQKPPILRLAQQGPRRRAR